MTKVIPITELPPRLLLDVNSDCNLKCPMCVVHGGSDDPKINAIIKKKMTVDNARAILDEVMSAKPAIGPALWSEPLMSKDILTHLKNMKDRELNVSINTNGLLLTKKIAKALIELKIDSITISVDSTTPETLKLIRGVDRLDKIESNILQMLELRGELELPRIGVSFTKQADNIHEHDEFIDRWVNIVDFVRTGELFEDGRFPEVNLDMSKRTPCSELYTTMAIHTDGDVSICCLDGFKDQVVGNVLEEGVSQVWQGEKLQQVRHYHETGQFQKVPFCLKCERWASNQYTEEVVDGILIRRSPEYTFYNNPARLENWNKNVRHTDS